MGCDNVIAIMRAHQLSSQSGTHDIASSFDHFGALCSVSVVYWQVQISMAPEMKEHCQLEGHFYRFSFMMAFKLACVISVPLRACYHNCKITL